MSVMISVYWISVAIVSVFFGLMFIKDIMKMKEEKDDKKIKSLPFVVLIVLMAIATPICNTLFALSLVFDLLKKTVLVIKKSFQKVKRAANKKRPQLGALEDIMETNKIYQKALIKATHNNIQPENRSAEVQSKFGKLSECSRNTLRLDEAIRYAQKNKMDEKVAEVLVENQMPFLYVSSVLIEHPDILDEYNSGILEKMDALVIKFSAKIREVQKNKEDPIREKEKLEKEKREEEEKQKRQEEERVKLATVNRINEEMDLILKTSEELKK